MTNEQLFKGLSILILTAAVATAVRYQGEYLPYLMSFEVGDLQMIETWKRAYETDTYGGSTPEETLQLFVDALKKGDVELASKYFLLEEQKEQFAFLKTYSSYDVMFDDIERGRFISGSDKAYFRFTDETGIASDVVFLKIPSGLWKIAEL